MKKDLNTFKGLEAASPTEPTVGDYLDQTFKAEDSKYADLAKRTHANSKQFCAKWNAGMEDFMNSMQVRRGYTDEMEKLIGVRDLGQHPDGIRGGVSALLGLTSKLEPKSSAGWNGFVISELLNYFTVVGEDKIFKQVAEARRTFSPFFVKDILEKPQQTVGEFVDALRKVTAEETATIDVSNVDAINEYVSKTIKAKWVELSTDSRLTAAEMEKRMAEETSQIFAWTLGRQGIMVTVYAHVRHSPIQMEVATTTHYMGIRYAKEYVLNPL